MKSANIPALANVRKVAPTFTVVVRMNRFLRTPGQALFSRVFTIETNFSPM
jgi:hypothetical protein